MIYTVQLSRLWKNSVVNMNSTQNKVGSPQSFSKIVEHALKNLDKPETLGMSSLLASPFILNHYLKPTTDLSEKERGIALRTLFEKVLDTMWTGSTPTTATEIKKAVDQERQKKGNSDSKYHYLILELRYFRKKISSIKVPVNNIQICNYLGVSESRFYVHLKEAQNRFATALLTQIQPSFRLESPPMEQQFIGREKEIKKIITHLKNGTAVNISGPVGIGKSSLASIVSKQWGKNRTFWYTFRLGFNDNHITLLYSLSHFLHLNNCYNLWRQLIAHQGEVHEIKPILGFLRQDLVELDFCPLFCFDEVDLITPNSENNVVMTHTLIIELLETIKQAENCALLLAGQKIVIDTDTRFNLAPFSNKEIAEMVQESSLNNVSPTEIKRITGGIPRIINLCMTLSHIGESDQLIIQGDMDYKPLFYRLWKRLSLNEQELLKFLAVFQSYCPEYIFDTETVNALFERYLILRNQSGGIYLQAYIGKIINSETSEVEKQQLHQNAAELWTQLTQYTQAAYHLVQAKQIEVAIDLWYKYQAFEINNGNALQAENVFSKISTNNISSQATKKNTYIQNQLAIYSGNLEKILDRRMEKTTWSRREKIFSKAMRQLGHAQFLLGSHSDAIETFDNTLEDLAQINNEIVAILHQKNRVFLEKSEFIQAKTIIEMAKFQVAYMEANYLMYQGHYSKGLKPLKAALAIAKSNENEQSVAWVQNMLAICYGNLRNIDSALFMATSAMEYYQKIGDKLHLYGLKAEIAGFYLNLENFEKVIAPGEEALAFFEKIEHEMRVPSLYSNLAEAYFGLNEFKKAKDYAYKAIHSENRRVQPYALYTLGQIHYKNGDMASALRSFNVGIEQAERNQDEFILAYLKKLFGEILLKEANREDGFPMLISASILFEKLDMIDISTEIAELIDQHVEDKNSDINNTKTEI